MAPHSTVCHESASTSHHCFTLGSRAPSRHLWVIIGSPCARQIRGWLRLGPLMSIHHKEAGPRVKSLHSTWLCILGSKYEASVNVTVPLQFLESIFTWPSDHLFSQASRNEWETRARVDLAGLTFFFIMLFIGEGFNSFFQEQKWLDIFISTHLATSKS